MSTFSKVQTPDSYSIGWSQDHHLFEKKLGVDRILHALDNAFPEHIFADLTMEVFGGDFFNHEVSNAHPDLEKVDNYIGRKLKAAAKYGVSIRVLDGTESHDRGQSRRWRIINDILETPADLKYVDTLCIETHPILGEILYIPDNWKTTADEVWEDVCGALKAKNLTMVDWVFMHGAFKHQLPPTAHKNPMIHDPERYISICRKYILVGHVHIHSQYKNILCAGSVDRSIHGEEEPKGTFLIHVRPHGDEIIFQENKAARIATTIDFKGLTAEEVVSKINAELDQYHPSVYKDIAIRIKSSKTDPACLMMARLAKVYPDITWSFIDADEKLNMHLIRLNEKPKLIEIPDLSMKNVVESLINRIGNEMTDGIATKINDLFKKYSLSNTDE